MRPVLFNIGPIPIRSYGFMVFVGFVIALWFTRRAAERRMAGRSDKEKGVITPDDVMNLGLVGLWVGIIGARILFVITDWKDFKDHLGDIPKIYQGGMTAYGAVIFGLIYLRWYCRRRKLSFLEFAGLIVPAMAFF